MINLLERILDKLDAIDHRLNGMDKIMVKQEENLEEHMKRTRIAEGQIQQVNKHVHMVEGAFKLIGVITAVLGLLKLLSII